MSTLIKRLRLVLSDGLIRTSGWLFATFMVTNVFNYGFQVAMGRLLTPAEFGFLNSLLAVLVVLSVPLATIPMVLARKTAEYRSQNDWTRIRSLFRFAHGRILLSGLLALAVFALGSSALAGYLHSPSVAPVLILGVCALSSFAVPINTAVLQGLQDYRWLGINAGLAGPVKFFLCVALALAGFGVNGVLVGLTLTQLTLWLTAYVPIRGHLRQGEAGVDHVHGLSLAHLFPVFVANLAFTILSQADIVLATRYFPAREAGMYAAAAILGRSVLYVPGGVVQALFPMVSEQSALRRDSRPLLRKALAATVLLSGAGAAAFFACPRLLIALFFGVRYADAAPILRYFGLAMLPMAIITVQMNYAIAQGQRFFPYVLAAGVPLEIIALHLYHGSAREMVFVIMAVGLLLAMFGWADRGRAPAWQELSC